MVVAKENTMIPRDQIPEEHCWDLGKLYENLERWRTDYKETSEDAGKITSYRGTLSQGAAAIRTAFDFYLAVSRRLEKLFVYAHLLSDSDTSNSDYLGVLQQAEALHAKVQAEASFLIPEFLALPDSFLVSVLQAPELLPIRRLLEEIRRYKEHTLGAAEENLLAAGSEIFSSSRKIFSQLTNADLDFGEVEVDGRMQPLTQASFVLFLRHPARSVRESAFTKFYSVFDGHRNTTSATLTSSIKKDLYFTNVRRFPSSLERSLFDDEIEPSIYDNVIDTISANLRPLHRYYELRKRLLGLSELKMYDTYVPLLETVRIKYNYQEAVEVIGAALAPLGERYRSVLLPGITAQRWVDRYENRGKRSGAYCSGCYDSPPYILLNYQDEDLSSVFTLAHEAGHAMHSWFSNSSQPYQDHSYSIFVAEVASTLNEQLLHHWLRKEYAGDKKKLVFLINQHLDEIKATLYRQVMFAEFEKTVHGLAAKNTPLTCDTYRSVYRELLKKYFGPGLELGPWDDLECFRIPHFYSSFYVYKYATGISAAAALAEKLLTGNDEAQTAYLSFLQSGCIKPPLVLLKEAGVDMSTPEAVLSALRLFADLLNQLEALLA